MREPPMFQLLIHMVVLGLVFLFVVPAATQILQGNKTITTPNPFAPIARFSFSGPPPTDVQAPPNPIATPNPNDLAALVSSICDDQLQINSAKSIYNNQTKANQIIASKQAEIASLQSEYMLKTDGGYFVIDQCK